MLVQIFSWAANGPCHHQLECLTVALVVLFQPAKLVLGSHLDRTPPSSKRSHMYALPTNTWYVNCNYIIYCEAQQKLVSYSVAPEF